VAAQPVPITGGVLRWARAEAGISTQQLAAEVGVPEETVKAWEAEAALPSTTEFHRLSKKLGRPESFFFLPTPPHRKTLAVEYRRRTGAPAVSSPDEARVIRQAKKSQQVVGWIRTRVDPEASVRIPSARTSDEPADVADVLRKWLGWSLRSYVGGDLTEASARNFVRASLQEKQIIVRHFSLPGTSIRGFALPHTMAPVIAVNTGDSQRARIFSYAHELAHLTVNDGSVCLIEENQGTERWCNKVAASLLMPESQFREVVRQKLGPRKASDIEDVRRIANFYRLSLRSIAVRLEDLGLADFGLFALVNRITENKKPGGVANPDKPQTKPRIRLQQSGRLYVSILIKAEEEGLFTPAQTLELLGLSRQEYNQLRQLIAVGDEG
jgi:Zn-dependent peptidase ImmA (M78 family)/transcriptional regulator with XRE-family HTH domain